MAFIIHCEYVLVYSSNLKGTLTLKASDCNIKALINHAICHTLDENWMKNKNVADVCITYNSNMEGIHLRLCDVTYLYVMSINRITKVIRFILTLFAFILIPLLKVVDFENGMSKYALNVT